MKFLKKNVALFILAVIKTFVMFGAITLAVAVPICMIANHKDKERSITIVEADPSAYHFFLDGKEMNANDVDLSDYSVNIDMQNKVVYLK